MAPKSIILTGPASMEDQAYYARSSVDGLSSWDLHRSLQRVGVASATVVDITRTPNWYGELAGVSLVIINLHGEPGEDGSIQGLLQLLGVPFLGSRVEASAVGLNKHLSKIVAISNGVPTPPFFTIGDGRERDTRAGLPGKVVCKPLRGGSSLGIRVIDTADQRLPDVGEWVVEPLVRGDDITVTVVEVDRSPVALPAIALKHGGLLYSEEEKLGPWPIFPMPAHRPERLHVAFRRCEELAVQMHQGIGARHLSRSDFVMPEGGEPQFLEINTMPGLSEASLAAHCGSAAGLRYDDFLTLVIAPSLRLF